MSGRRTALVTGTASGIGRAIADRLGSDGLRVVGVDVQPQTGTEFDTVEADLAQTDVCRKVVDSVGPVDVLVNNAAVLISKPTSDFSDADFDTTIAVNLRAPFVLSVAVAQGMKNTGWGRIINVSSVGARTGGIADSCVYSASKAGLVSITKNFARTLGAYGITANAVLPGGIDTAMARLQFEGDETLRDHLLSASPVGRLGQAVEVGSVVSFLASADSDYVNGASIDVNGGWYMA